MYGPKFTLSYELYEHMVTYARANYEKAATVACVDDVLAYHLNTHLVT